jgi:hypothetical protein
MVSSPGNKNTARPDEFQLQVQRGDKLTQRSFCCGMMEISPQLRTILRRMGLEKRIGPWPQPICSMAAPSLRPMRPSGFCCLSEDHPQSLRFLALSLQSPL